MSIQEGQPLAQPRTPNGRFDFVLGGSEKSPAGLIELDERQIALFAPVPTESVPSEEDVALHEHLARIAVGKSAKYAAAGGQDNCIRTRCRGLAGIGGYLQYLQVGDGL